MSASRSDPLCSALARMAELHPGLSLVDGLAREMADRWQQGERPLAEEFLQRHPELVEDLQAVLRLLFEEFCLRQEQGETDAADRLLERFPPWRSQLALLLDCHRLFGEPVREQPRAGQTVAEYELLQELGRGGQGKVFLARQSALANRPVVIKFSRCTGGEHLALAQLQHTHIVPLFAAHEEVEQDRRILCMPYLGGASLASLLEALQSRPSVQADGRDLIEALDQLQARLPIPVPSRGKVRDWLKSRNYEQILCWFGVCLAEALHHAHERGLVHLDLTTANVLVTAEGLPMLLDFHLARGPLRPGDPGSQWLGGTPGYMAPEQLQAFLALGRGEPLPCGVDHRADIYALGQVLHQALIVGNTTVSVGLGDIVARCLALKPEERYQSAAELAEDLRRQLAGMPLRGVPNRSLAERWRKWRRRQPHSLPLLCALLALLTAGLVGVSHIRSNCIQAETDLLTGRELLGKEQFPQARQYLERGRGLAVALPGSSELVRSFDRSLQEARHGLASQEREQVRRRLHTVVEQFRLLIASLPDQAQTSQTTRTLERTSRELWTLRQQLVGPDSIPEARLGRDLLDLAIIGASLNPQRAESLRILEEARQLCGTSAALVWELRRHRQALGIREEQPEPIVPPRTAWEHLILGRSLLAGGRLDEAQQELTRTIEREPQHFWAHYYLGVAAYRRGSPAQASQSFTVCLALCPDSARCYHNRALVLTELGQTEQARRDYTRALELDPKLASAAFNRGLLHARSQRYPEALRDLQHALEHGTDRATVEQALLQVRQAWNGQR